MGDKEYIIREENGTDIIYETVIFGEPKRLGGYVKTDLGFIIEEEANNGCCGTSEACLDGFFGENKPIAEPKEDASSYDYPKKEKLSFFKNIYTKIRSLK